MPDEITPAVKTYEALIRKLKDRKALVARAVESAQGYRFQNGILYLRYPAFSVSVRTLTDSKHKPILDQAAIEMSIQVVLE